MLQYQYDRDALVIQERKNENDIEFLIKVIRDDGYVDAIHRVRSDFDHNTIYTDALFYTHHNNEYQVIVRSDYYVDFVLCLFKHRLLKSVAWR